MKSSTVPMICGAALVAMSAAGLSHWCSVRQFAAAIQGGVPLAAVAAPAAQAPSPAPVIAAAPRLVAQAPKNPAPAPVNDPTQKKFYETLIAKMESLQNQNRDLLNQVAETNRDMMNLNFRVDTFSDSFRPMPVSEDRPDTSFADGPGILPPRAEPVVLSIDQ
jgi:cytochrome c-type biogenesis protein CcmH/NrfF